MSEAEKAPAVLEGQGGSSCSVYYSDTVARRIADHYAEGKSLHWISQLSEMPRYNTILRWAKENTEFRMLLDAVRTERALHFEDKAIESAENARGKDADRLRFDAYKWGAEVNDPTRYGKKVTHGGDSSRPITFVINTGFPEPNVNQRPPVLGPDGLIQRAKPVEAEVADAQVSSDTRKDEGDGAGGNAEVRSEDVVCGSDAVEHKRVRPARPRKGHKKNPA